MLIFAEFLPSKFFDFFENCYKAPKQWYQGGDSNSRPPAYEPEVSFIGEILSKHIYNKLKHDKYYNKSLQEQFKNKKHIEALTLDFTSYSLQTGQKSENNCRVFADPIRSAEAQFFSFMKLLKSKRINEYI